MINFLSSIGIIKNDTENWKEDEKNYKKQSRRKSSDLEIEQILLDSKKEEDLIFYHYSKNTLVNLKFEEKENVPNFGFLEYDIEVEDEKLYFDEKEIENIKTYHVLNVLKPKIEKYLSYKDIEFNCTFMQNIYAYAEEIGFENTIGYLIPLIQDLNFQKTKCDRILIAFLDTFEKFLIYLKQFDLDHKIIIKKLFPIISNILLMKREMNLLKRAVKELKFLIDNITMDECLNHVIPLLIEIGNNENDEIGQIIFIQIFSDKASFFGGQTIELYVLPMYLYLSESNNEKLRVYCLKSMIPFMETVNYEIIQSKFIKIYNNFTKDISLEIRKLSCTMLPLVCKTILNNNNGYDNSKIKKEELISNNLLNIFFSLTKDEGKEIQDCTIMIFGEFIYYLDNNKIISNPNLLDYYLDKITKLLKEMNDKKTNSNLIYKVCFSFPLILQIYCKKINDVTEKNKNWERLKPIYFQFIISKEFKIRKSIAASFGMVSSILDQKIVEVELSPIVLGMYNSNFGKIRNAIIGVIPNYLINIKDPKIRSQFLVIYKKNYDNNKNSKNWRERLKYLKGIKTMGNNFNNSIIFEDLIGMIIEMCFDPLNIIRKKSIKILSLFILKFLLINSEKSDNSEFVEKESIDYKKSAIIVLKNFATCKNFHYRQLFVYLCKKIIANEKIFKEYAFEFFIDLSYDKIFNVRYTLASFINKIWNKNKDKYKWIHENEKMIEIIYRLKNDKENEVKNAVEKIDINIDKIENKEKILEIKKVNKKFNNDFREFKTIFGFKPSIWKSWIKKGK